MDEEFALIAVGGGTLIVLAAILGAYARDILRDRERERSRREIAAYEFQKLYLDPDDYVVPPFALRCIPLDQYRVIDENPSPNFEGARCVYGMVVAWLSNVDRPDVTLQPYLFSTDPRYSYHFANLNLFTFLTAHRDANPGNFLMSTDPDNPQVFAIDNGIALLTEDRKALGLFLTQSVAFNTTISSLETVSNSWGVINQSREQQLVQDYVKRLNVKTSSISTVIGTPTALSACCAAIVGSTYTFKA